MMSGNIENGREYLLHVMECLKKRLARQMLRSLRVRKRSRICTNITGKTIQRWMSTVMKILITSRRFSVR